MPGCGISIPRVIEPDCQKCRGTGLANDGHANRRYPVNVDKASARTVVVQGGAYGEHRIESVETGGKTFPVNGRSFTVRLAAGAGARLVLSMRRYSEQPTELFPEGVQARRK